MLAWRRPLDQKHGLGAGIEPVAAAGDRLINLRDVRFYASLIKFQDGDKIGHQNAVVATALDKIKQPGFCGRKFYAEADFRQLLTAIRA